MKANSKRKVFGDAVDLLMNWKSASIYIISSVTEQIKKLCVHNRNNKIKGIIGI